VDSHLCPLLPLLVQSRWRWWWTRSRRTVCTLVSLRLRYCICVVSGGGARLVRTCTRIGRTYPRNARRDGSGGRGRRRFVPCISCRRRETRVGYPTDTGGWRSATSSSAGRGINRTCWCWCWCWSWPDGRRAHYCQGRTTLMAQALYIWRRQLAHARTQATPATFDLLTETHPKQNATTSCSPAAA
jgi:hypothetical protein